MKMRFPLDPWESIFIVDGARAAAGLPVYEPLDTGHATHMYGPLGTYLMGGIFKITGPSVRVGRWISLFSGMVATLLYTALFVPRRNPIYLIIGGALFFSLHIRCMGLFTNTRPDITAFLLATIALIAAYQAQNRRSLGLYIASAVLIVLAFLFKQTYAVAALIPPLAVVILRPDGWRKLIWTALIPLAAIAATAMVLKFGFPNIWFYMVDVPKQYRIFASRVNLGLMTLFMNNPLFLATAVMVIFHIGFDRHRDPVLAWLFIAMLVGGVMGIFAFAKQGGNYNSLLMIYGPMTAFCMFTLPRVIDALIRLRPGPAVSIVTGLMLALLLSTTAFGVPLSMRLAFTHAGNTSDYSRVIEVAKNLDGRVLCPEEPTIMLFARGKYEKNLSAEVEAIGNAYRATVEQWLDRNAREADWIITVSTPDLPGRLAAFMPDFGFRQVPRRELKSGYTLWQRIAPTSAPQTP